MSKRRGAGVLVVIALFKLVKATLLITLGVEALSLVHDPDTAATLRHLVGALRIDPENSFIHGAIARISGLDARRLEALSVGTFVYAAVFLVEGIGLLFRKRWAEYLTTLVTASFIPIEIYEMARHPSLLKSLGIAVNTLIVAYLGRWLWLERTPNAMDSFDDDDSAAAAPAPPVPATARSVATGDPDGVSAARRASHDDPLLGDAAADRESNSKQD